MQHKTGKDLNEKDDQQSAVRLGNHVETHFWEKWDFSYNPFCNFYSLTVLWRISNVPH